ncbi:MAG: hypothetical protein AAF532_06090 [Planctomycetota bacterium]
MSIRPLFLAALMAVGFCLAAAEAPAQVFVGVGAPVVSYYGPTPYYYGHGYYAPAFYGTAVRAPFVSVNIGRRYIAPAPVVAAPVVAAPVVQAPVVVQGPRRVVSRRVVSPPGVVVPAGGVVTGYRGWWDDDFEVRYPGGLEVEYEFEDGRWEVEIDD